ncbi:hypothetical protein MKO06_13150 [Gramella sp. GC03-9]|uniref:NIPSNAP domain-containing protein n=1 Tax=Christiangramia oceanisediminis TaxID=2920386 RepID=A0A9X2RDT3_9FLAO|nr:hypothetical protein [Gramella oceanisediminis]MCP9200861.1 hypothetical protein [Gramella oceanisediminis]
MKRLVLLLFILIFSLGISAQQQETYLIFEFMKVDNDQEPFYMETEDFWEKIHEQRVKNGDIMGWDLWQLLPGGEEQGYQYLTVTVFNDPLKMMNAAEGIMQSARTAYPTESDEDLEKRLDMAGGSRDLSVRLFIHVINSTTDDFEMKPGMVASIDLMKANPGQMEAYEKAENDVFKPFHQKVVDGGAKGNWQLLKVLLPQGSDVYTSHITVNMFDNWKQYIESSGFDAGLSSQDESRMQKGLETREMKWVYMANLVKMIR